mgnify:CR=1
LGNVMMQKDTQPSATNVIILQFNKVNSARLSVNLLIKRLDFNCVLPLGKIGMRLKTLIKRVIDTKKNN